MPGTQPSSWVSDNPAIATVDQNGLVTGVSVGTCGITAQLQAVVSNVVGVTVGPDTAPATIEVTPTSLNLQVGKTAQLTAVVKNDAGQPI